MENKLLGNARAVSAFKSHIIKSNRLLKRLIYLNKTYAHINAINASTMYNNFQILYNITFIQNIDGELKEKLSELSDCKDNSYNSNNDKLEKTKYIF